MVVALALVPLVPASATVWAWNATLFVVGVVALLWVMSQMFGREFHLVSTLLSAPLLLLASYAVMRYGLTEVEPVARREVVRLLGMAMLFFIATNVVHHRWHLALIVWILVALGVVVAFQGLWQLLVHNLDSMSAAAGIASEAVIRGPFAKSSEYVTFLHLVFPVAAANFLFSRYSLLLRVLCAFAAAIIVVAMAAAGQLSYWYGWLMSITVLGIYLMQKRGWKLRWALLGAGVLLLVVGATWLAAHKLQVVAPPPLSVPDEFSGPAAGTARSEASLPLWRSAVTMALRNPWIGIGPGMFPWRYPSYRGQQGTPLDANNNYLTFLAEYGAVGFILVFSGIVAFVIAAIQILHARARRYSASTASNRYAFVVAGLSVSAAALVDGMLGGGFNACANQLTLLIVMAATLTCALHNRNDSPDKAYTPGKLTLFRLTGVHRVLLGVGSALMLLLFLWLLVTTSPGAVFLSRAQDYVSRKEWAAAEVFYLRALRSDPRNYDAMAGLGDVYVARAAGNDAEAAVLRDQALNQYERAFILNPYANELHAKMGQVYDEKGDREKAADQYKLAIQGDSRNAVYHIAYARHCQKWGETKLAEESLRRAAALDPALMKSPTKPSSPDADE